MSNSDRIRNCLFLGAVGDALGKPVEFSRTATIEKNHGANPPEQLAYASSPPAEFTDDTQMTLFVAEGLVRAVEKGVAGERAAFRDEIAQSLLHWLATQDSRVLEDVDATGSTLLDVEGMHRQQAPGNTCLSSCRHIYRGGELPDMSNRINDSKGCGAVMRSAPFGLVADTADEAFGWARDAGVLTHCHPSGYLSAGYFAATIQSIAAGEQLEEAMAGADELLAKEPGADETAQAVQAAREATADGALSLDRLIELGEGWVGEEALSMALACALDADATNEASIRQTLWLSVRHGGDSDSTGALTGNLLGALATREALPEKWLEELEMRQVIADCADRLCGASSGA